MINIFSRNFKYLILLLALFLLLINFNKPFYGHHDWNGVFFGNIIRNTVKFGFLKTKFGAVQSWLPASPSEFRFYTHYPPVFHILLGLEGYLLGIHEWSMRLLAIIFSLMAVYMIYKISGQLFNQKTAILTSFFVIFTPMFLYFGKMPVHEVFGLPLIIYSFYRYFVFFQEQTKRNLFILIGSLILVCQTVWSGYYLAPLFMIHYWFFKYRQAKKRDRNLYLIILVPILSFISHLIHTYILTGSFTNNLFSTMVYRMQLGPRNASDSFSILQYIKQESLWVTVYFTKTLCLLSFIYSLKLIITLFKKIFDYKDGLLLIIYIFPFIDLVIFKNVYFIHDYKLYYFLLSLPFFAALGLYFIIDEVALLWSKNITIKKFVFGLITLLFVLEKLPFTKTLIKTSMNKEAWNLGKTLKSNSSEQDVIAVGSNSFGEFFAPFLNFYSERTIVFFNPQLQDFEELKTIKPRLIVFIKGREIPEPALIADINKEYVFQENLIYKIK